MSTSTEAKDLLNVSAEQMHAALEVYREQGATAEQLQLVEWAFVHCLQDLGRSRTALARELGYDATNVWKLFMGRYEGSIANVADAIAAARERARRRVSVGFVETPVTRRIAEAIDYAHTMSAMVVIRGDTGRSKTATAGMWHSEHNHGTSFYCELEERMTYARFLRKVARAMGASASGSSDGYRAYVERRLGRNRTLIVDEAGHLYNERRPDPSAFDFLRTVHDQTHCGLVLIFTLPYWSTITRGRIAPFFEQFLGRVSYELEIPADTVFAEEVDAICAEFCRRAGCEPDAALLKQAAQIAAEHRGRLRTLVSTLEHAVVYARQTGKPLGGKTLKAARAWRDAGGDWSKLTTIEKGGG